MIEAKQKLILEQSEIKEEICWLETTIQRIGELKDKYPAQSEASEEMNLTIQKLKERKDILGENLEQKEKDIQKIKAKEKNERGLFGRSFSYILF